MDYVFSGQLHAIFQGDVPDRLLACVDTFLCWFFFFSLFQASHDTKASVARLEARYRAPQTLEASFLSSVTRNNDVDCVRVEAGTALF